MTINDTVAVRLTRLLVEERRVGAELLGVDRGTPALEALLFPCGSGEAYDWLRDDQVVKAARAGVLREVTDMLAKYRQALHDEIRTAALELAGVDPTPPDPPRCDFSCTAGDLEHQERCAITLAHGEHRCVDHLEAELADGFAAVALGPAPRPRRCPRSCWATLSCIDGCDLTGPGHTDADAFGTEGHRCAAHSEQLLSDAGPKHDLPGAVREPAPGDAIDPGAFESPLDEGLPF